MNHYRTVRLLSIETIWRAAQASYNSVPRLCELCELHEIGHQVRELTLAMVHGFCASIPQQCGYHEQLYPKSWKSGGSEPQVKPSQLVPGYDKGRNTTLIEESRHARE